MGLILGISSISGERPTSVNTCDIDLDSLYWLTQNVDVLTIEQLQAFGLTADFS
jgi:hypothetical protein